jgi:anti-sigma regulatory factor (Ser/Thr protein kinase)
VERTEDRIDVTLGVPPAAGAPLRARREVDALGLPSPVSNDVKLLVSELVTNSVVHAGLPPDQDIALRLGRKASTLRVEVCDRGRGFAESLLKRTHTNGFGLYLVEQLSDRWGVERGAQTCVWFEVDLSGW